LACSSGIKIVLKPTGFGDLAGRGEVRQIVENEHISG
jgi:hypothetical protein